MTGYNAGNASQIKQALVLYHRNCLDGFTAAWVVHKALHGNADFVGINYGEELAEPIEGREVYMVDFSMPADTVRQMCQLAKSVDILDHHESAAKELSILQEERAKGLLPNLTLVFDMERAGCQIAWDYFYPQANWPDCLIIPRPKLVDIVADRDLWRFAHGREYVEKICAALYSYEQTFFNWDDLFELRSISSLEAEGEALVRVRKNQVKQLTKDFQLMSIGGYTIPVVNCPGFLASEVGESLALQYPQFPFAATYFDTSECRIFSLRSKKIGGLRVNDVAEGYIWNGRKGGGHPNAAGFKAPIGFIGTEFKEEANV